jgi:carbamate kinase
MPEPPVLVALGGNALLKPHEVLCAADQYEAVARTSRMLADVFEASPGGLVITHGNGPQVGSLLIQNEDARRDVPPMPLDVLGAESQGQIGYMLQQGMSNELARRGVHVPVVTLLTRTLVDATDPAFQSPTKPVGPFYSQAESDWLAREKRWVMREQPDGWRRVVPSPDPLEIIEAPVVACMVDQGYVVVAAGGGGVPVARGEGGLVGLEGVVDKDLASQRLASAIGVRRMLILTTVRHVMRGFGTPAEEPLTQLGCAEARRMVTEGELRAGSMAPKVEAACRFVEAGGELAVIARLDEAADALDGAAGTRIWAESCGGRDGGGS